MVTPPRILSPICLFTCRSEIVETETSNGLADPGRARSAVSSNDRSTGVLYLRYRGC